MDMVQIAFVNIGWQKHVQRLRLINEVRAVASEVNQPALVDLKRGFEHGFFVLIEETQMLHRPARCDD